MSFITQTHDVVQEIQVNGTYKGRTAYAFSILGKRDDTFSEAKGPLYDIGEYLGSTDEIFNDPSAGVVMTIKSSDANDTNSSGTGMRKVKYVFLDSSNNLQTETVNMNGTTAVSLNGGVAIKYIEVMEGNEVGSTMHAVGNITIQNTAETIIYDQITANGNRSLSCRFKVPNGYTGYVRGWTGTCANQRMDIRLRAQSEMLGSAVTPCHHFLDIMYIQKDTSFVQPNLPWIKVLATGEIKSSVIPDVTTSVPSVTSTIQVVIIANS
jgi:hypothetical protein